MRVSHIGQVAAVCMLALLPVRWAVAQGVIRADCDPAHAQINHLSWDADGGPRVKTNLLRDNAAVRLRDPVTSGPAATAASDPSYRILNDPGSYAMSVTAAPQRVELAVSGHPNSGMVQLLFPFDPRVTPTTVLAEGWHSDGTFSLPAIINAPDFGAVLVTEFGKTSGVRGRLQGSRTDKWVDLILDLTLVQGSQVHLALEPLTIAPPAGMQDLTFWQPVSRGWLNLFQPCAQWGEQGRPFSAPAGILGNNVISDPASCALTPLADHMLLMHQLAPGVSIAPTLRRSLDWWFDERVRPTGEMVCYWDYGNFLDANACPIIAAWDYVQTTNDVTWLARRIERIEFIAGFLVRRDVDRDGLVEATQSGNLGTLQQPGRSCNWWDALNCGHKDTYSNAMIYRAWRCLAALERQLERREQAARYTALADALRSAYVRTLYNPATGWLAGWKSLDGEMHDYASPTLNGMAIEYGLVEPDLARQILERLWKKIDAVGFTRFDLGIPPVLVPVRRGDYLLPDAIGCPKREDGTDTFGQYMNGGISAGHTLHFLVANYRFGDAARADAVLRRMLERQSRGEFQNGVTDAAFQGIDWTTWDGKPCGYEGYLADTFCWLQAVLLREPAFRDKLYAPLMQP